MPEELVPGLVRYATVVAIWPAPVDADACFAAAGFHDFGDSDVIWDQDWRRVVSSVIHELQQTGTPHVRTEADLYTQDAVSLPRRAIGWFLPDTLPRRRVHEPLVDQIIAVTGDARLGEVHVEFGDPATSSLSAGMGHAILWLGFATIPRRPEDFVEHIAVDLPAIKTPLDWRKLLPCTGPAGK